MRRLLLIILFSLLSSALPATVYAASCYTNDEAEAEQGIRIHSELMVIGLNCQHMFSAGSKNLYITYREFTSEHAKLFEAYEEDLLTYFSRTGARNPEAALNTLRTAFANKISNDAARMRPDMFCNRYAPRISKVANMDRATLQRWAGTFYPSHPVTKPICEQ